MFDENLIPINPVHFFALACDCHHLDNEENIPSLSRFALPSTNALTQEEPFAKIAMGWHEEGLGFNILVDQKGIRSIYPQLDQGDSVELFIDTRDMKSAGFNTRFCHHFFFLPEPVEDIVKGEITRFRTEDSHPLCDSQALYCQTQIKKNSYQMKIFIPIHCMYGYDPKQFDRLGFTYRINRYHAEPQHFAVVSQDYPIDQQPSLWGSLKFVK